MNIRSAFSALVMTLIASQAAAQQVDVAQGADAKALPDTFEIEGYADDPTYGYRPWNPIRLGGITAPPADDDFRSKREILLQRLLKSSTGEDLTWHSVERWNTVDPATGRWRVRGTPSDMYLVSAPGGKPIRLYVNSGRPAPIYAPIGFGYFSSAAMADAAKNWMGPIPKGGISQRIDLLTTPAEAGEVLAQFYLGVTYLDLQQPQKAFPWFEKAANQNHGPSQMMLASMYRQGNGVARNTSLARQWLHRAATNRVQRARVELAQNYAFGNGEVQDWRKAAYHTYLAARQGHPKAQRNLAEAFLSGRGLPKNRRLGLGWLAASSAAGDKKASEMLDKQLPNAKPTVRKHLEKAGTAFLNKPQPSDHVSTILFKLHFKNKQAQYEYAQLLLQGFEIEPNKHAGLILFFMLAKEGHKEAAKMLATLEHVERPDVMERAKRSAEMILKQRN